MQKTESGVVNLTGVNGTTVITLFDWLMQLPTVTVYVNTCAPRPACCGLNCPAGVTPVPLQTPPAGVAPVTVNGAAFWQTLCFKPAMALLTAKSNLKAAALQLSELPGAALPFWAAQALGVVGKALVPPQPPQTAW